MITKVIFLKNKIQKNLIFIKSGFLNSVISKKTFKNLTIIFYDSNNNSTFAAQNF